MILNFVQNILIILCSTKIMRINEDKLDNYRCLLIKYWNFHCVSEILAYQGSFKKCCLQSLCLELWSFACSTTAAEEEKGV